MAIARGQVDRFGKPIPPNQSVKVFINADGTVPQQRETVKLDSKIVATDDPDTQATLLSVTGVGSVTSVTGTAPVTSTGGSTPAIGINNTGATAGRAGLDVLIQEASPTGASGTYSTTTWAPGLYKSIHLEIQQTATSSGAGIGDITLVGLTGTVTARQMLVNTLIQENSFGRNAIKAGWNGSMPCSGTWDFFIPAAPMFKSFSSACFLRAPTAQAQYQTGDHDDVTHEVTGLSWAIVGAGTLDFNFRLWGIPA